MVEDIDKKIKELGKFPEEDEVLFGTVDRITGTSVFVKLDDYDKEGVISFSEIAPGRIRNIRDYVRIGQKIVVKVLRVNKEKAHIDLSLRRVSAKEKKEVVDENKKQKEFEVILNLVIKNKEKTNSLINELRRKIKFRDLFSKFISEPKEIESLLKQMGLSEEELKRVLEIMSEKIKEKKVVVKSKIVLSCEASNGIERIKTLLLPLEKEGVVISYLGAPNYLISLESMDYKEANKKLKELLDTLTLKAKDLDCKLEFSKEK
ncbi:MAG: S1 RNA-binding domain-containing protein [Candidatus Pacearchaeota archaeon]|nr:S1 RNA-binding domain-containing protein [Candidatus Pacearchaeota archaeon]